MNLNIISDILNSAFEKRYGLTTHIKQLPDKRIYVKVNDELLLDPFFFDDLFDDFRGQRIDDLSRHVTNFLADQIVNKYLKKSYKVLTPALNCSNEELVKYIRSMKGGERVMEMSVSCMQGCKGTVEVHDDGEVCIRWDHQEYADGAGVMVTSFTSGARIIDENDVYKSII
jgi:hypothetical protein